VPAQTRKALLVPDMAVFTDQAGKYVLVCNEKDTVEIRRIKTAESVREFRVIESGLSQNDRVIVNGLQRARPGTMVKGSQSQLQITNAAADYPELQKN
jgi:multidrug efflux system membrane fusion protein